MVELFKQIIASVKLSLAVGLASGAIVLFKKMNYSLVQFIPEEWIGGITIVFIFSVIFFFLSIVFSLGNFSIKLIGNAKDKINSISFPTNLNSLSQLELSMMFELAKLADESWDIDRIDYTRSDTPSKLEVLAASKSLNKQGLVDINPYDENLISLSQKGRTVALEIMNKFKNNN